MPHEFANIPQVEKLLEASCIRAWFPALSRPLVARIVSDVLAQVREGIRKGEAAPDQKGILDRIAEECRRRSRKRIRKVLNATGVILHTNLGRSPIPAPVWEASAGANTGYSNLEMELASGKRGGRSGIIPELLAAATGCEAAVVVNNNAAAVLLMLSALAPGRGVIVSRGEQVQIGGGFRIPEILALSGARLIEVGTTNITTLSDYTAAVTPETAMALVVHSSNFRVRGFTEKPDLAELARSLPPHVVLAVDQGSGALTEDIPGETRVRSYLARGAHLVSFSADKLVGGPQAGIIVGKADLVRVLSSHPLMRAFRPGKTIYSLLEEHLVRRLEGSGRAHGEWLLSLPVKELERMGERILAALPQGSARLVESRITTGGGSSPDESVPSLSIELLAGGRAGELLARLRDGEVPLIATIADDAVRLSLATLYGEDEASIAQSIRAALGA